LGFDEIYLHADADYQPAVTLYEKLGYGIIRDDPEWVSKLNRIRMRYMKKSLP